MADGNDSLAFRRRFHPNRMGEPSHRTETASDTSTAQDGAWIDRPPVIVAVAQGHLEILERGPRVVRAQFHALPVLCPNHRQFEGTSPTIFDDVGRQFGRDDREL